MGINEQKKTVKIPKFEKETNSADLSEANSIQSDSPRKGFSGLPLPWAVTALILIISMIVATSITPRLINFIAGPPNTKPQTNMQ